MPDQAPTSKIDVDTQLGVQGGPPLGLITILLTGIFGYAAYQFLRK